MKVYCMRHGQTNYNLHELCNDDPSVDVHLTETGIAQAGAAAENLRGVALDLIITSELPRTQQTAAIINRFHDVPVQAHPLVNDIRSGFEGRPVGEYFAATAHDPLHASANGGESLLEHRRRVTAFYDWLRTQAYKTVLVVAHEETLRVLQALRDGLPDGRMRDLHFDNAQILEIDTGGPVGA